MAQKKIPSRQCIGCMTSRPKKELVRVVRAPSGEISIDLVGKKPGRGAYLCRGDAALVLQHGESFKKFIVSCCHFSGSSYDLLSM